MTDRRDGFPPTAASGSTALHDGSSERPRWPDVYASKRGKVYKKPVVGPDGKTITMGYLVASIGEDYAEFDVSEIIAHQMNKGEAADELYDALASTLALARLKWGNLDEGANQIFAKADAALAKATGTESPSYQRSSEGTRDGGQQTPTQNEGE